MNESVILNSRRSGKGPVLVILHGLFGNLDNFASASLHLERHVSVIRMDLPSHGLSARLPALDFASMARAVGDTLQELQVGRCHLLGHSLGGKVAMALAADPHGLQIERLIVVDIAPKDYPPHHQGILDALTALELATLNSRGDAERQLRSAITDAGVRAFLLKSLYRNEAGEFAWRFDLAGLQRDYGMLSRAPGLPHTIEVPTLFIKGENSDYLSPSDEALIRRHVTHPELKQIGGAGHWPHAEKPAVFARIVADFIHGNSNQHG